MAPFWILVCHELFNNVDVTPTWKIFMRDYWVQAKDTGIDIFFGSDG